jgi:hypothetical protein
MKQPHWLQDARNHAGRLWPSGCIDRSRGCSSLSCRHRKEVGRQHRSRIREWWKWCKSTYMCQLEFWKRVLQPYFQLSGFSGRMQMWHLSQIVEKGCVSPQAFCIQSHGSRRAWRTCQHYHICLLEIMHTQTVMGIRIGLRIRTQCALGA